MKRIFPILTLSLLITLYTLTLGYLSIARHWSFQTAKLGLGINHQAVWSTLHGHPFHLTEGSSLAYHFVPLFFLLAPFLLVWDKMGIFLITSSLIYAVCAFSFIIPNYAKQTFGENYIYLARP